ncbi:hypothetical protein NDU88_004195 [Pleurodeles waltl]|uniref:Uncharacterized protein n=1 Tax=Pleurodeles waltl TaxID=8319 RepID=A0AAV7T7E8_PLEWA|nr:hypothetical protein NDU88_004195 [Pleurodeles waltl]
MATRHSDIQIGDFVILKDKHPGWKLWTPYEPEVRKVGWVNGTLITVRLNERSVTYNISWFKRVVPNEESAAEGLSHDEEEIKETWGHPTESSTEVPLPRQEGDASQTQRPARPQEPDARCQGEATSRSKKYDLHPIPTPS